MQAYLRGAAGLGVMLASFVLLGASAKPGAVPKAMLGRWYHGPCSHPDQRLTITPTRAKLGAQPAAGIVYYPNDDGAGNGAIHWRAQFSVDNFVYLAAHNRIVHNTQGYHMPDEVVFRRCPAM